MTNNQSTSLAKAKHKGHKEEIEMEDLKANEAGSSIFQRNTFLRQMRAMLKKNAVLQKRFIVGTVCECLFPIILILLSCIYVLLFKDLLNVSDSSYIVHYPETNITNIYDSDGYKEACINTDEAEINASGFMKPCMFAIFPSTSDTQTLGSHIHRKLFVEGPQPKDLRMKAPTFQYFNTEEEFREEMNKDPTLFFAAIHFSEYGDTVNYTLFMNGTQIPVEYSRTIPVQFYVGRLVYSNSTLYSGSGFMAIQQAIDASIIEVNIGINNENINTTAETEVQIQEQISSFDSSSSLSDSNNTSGLKMKTRMQFLPGFPPPGMIPVIPIFICTIQTLSCIPFIAVCLIHLVNEEVSKTKEYLSMLGLKKSVYWGSWFITFIIPAIIISIFGTIFNYAFSIFSGQWFMIFLLFLIFELSCILFSFFASTFVHSSILAMVLSALWGYVPAILLVMMPISRPAYIVFSIISSPWGFNYALYKKTILDTNDDYTIDIMGDELSWGIIFLLLIVNCIIYGALAWYISEVSPGEYGVPKPYNFPFTKEYWFPKSVKKTFSEGIDNQNHDKFEDPLSPNGNGVVLKKLTKTFQSSGGPPVHAVGGVSAIFPRGQITALLGHNGAGKTTTISMLVGLITPTGGDALIEDKSILSQMEEIRESIGICPQADLLYPDLTAPEHLELVGNLRGMTKEELPGAIEQALNDMGLPLSEHRNAIVKTFSAGQKRKLSIAISLFANPKVVFLDEPTTGVDALSRRSIWDALARAKQNKTIILTTHSMEEADALCNHIYIMSAGLLKCGGSSIFLKRNFGSGFYLNLEKLHGCNTKDVVDFVKNDISDVTLLGDSEFAMELGIPFGNDAKFASLFDHLDKKAKELKLGKYGMTLTTLEDVFIKMSMDYDSEMFGGGIGKGITSTGISYDIVPVSKPPPNKEQYNTYDFNENDERPHASILRQAYAIWLMNVLFYFNSIKRTIIVYLIPTFFMLLFLVPAEFLSRRVPDPIDEPVLNSFAALNSTEIPYTSISATDVNQADLASFISGLEELSPDLVFKKMDSISEIEQYTSKVGYFTGAIGFHKLSVENKEIDTVILGNNTRTGSFVTMQNIINNGFSHILNSSATITTWQQPTNPDIVAERKSAASTFGIFMVIGLLLGLLVSAAFGTQRLVAEKECKFKSQMYVCGLNPKVYVVVNVLASFVAQIIPATLAIICAIIFETKGATGILILALFLTCFIFLLALSSFNFCFSKLFKKADSCIKWIIIAQVVIAIIPFALDLLLSLFASKKRESSDTIDNAIDAITYILGIFPSSAFATALTSLTGCSEESMSAAFSWDRKLAPEFLTLALDFVLYFIIGVVWETKEHSVSTPDESIIEPDEDEHKDVAKERKRVMSGKADKDGIAIKGLSKVFDETVVAVNNLTLGIRPNECFGMLGPNGSGKSTTINTISGELKPSHGTAFINRTKMVGSKLNYFLNAKIGRCLQEDALVNYLSPYNHIYLLELLRTGSSKVQISVDIAEAIKNIGLEKFAHRPAGTLSGGTRRKLSVAIAMLAGTNVILLDEPSTGMDPVTRRYLWAAIQKECSKEGRSVLITTHSMEEAEAVCTNIGIVIRGGLKCYGTIQHLKATFGDGYRAIIELEPEGDPDECDKLIKKICKKNGGSSSLIDVAGPKRTYNIGKISSLGNFFRELEKAKDKYHMRSYTINQTSLEDVFMLMVKSDLESHEGAEV